MARGRKRSIAGWGLIGVGAILTALMFVSCWWGFEYQLPYSAGANRLTTFHLSRGELVRHVHISIEGAAPADEPGRFVSQRLSDPGLRWWYLDEPHSVGVMRAYTLRLSGQINEGYATLLWPWTLLALGLGATFVAGPAWLSRKGPTNNCPTCRYDRAGLGPDQPCPECGQAPSTLP